MGLIKMTKKQIIELVKKFCKDYSEGKEDIQTLALIKD